MPRQNPTRTPSRVRGTREPHTIASPSLSGSSRARSTVAGAIGLLPRKRLAVITTRTAATSAPKTLMLRGRTRGIAGATDMGASLAQLGKVSLT